MTNRMLCMMIAVISLMITHESANAKLISKDRLATCKMHAVGIYAPEDHHADDRVYVDVNITAQPIVLVLSSYFGAQWNLKVADGVDIRQIIVPGYFEQEVVGAPEGVPVEMITWFTKDDKDQRKDFFFTHAFHTHDGREFQSRLLEMTGLPLSTFQGLYNARTFTVDGMKGADLSATGSTGDQQSLINDRSKSPFDVMEKATKQLGKEIRGGKPSPEQLTQLKELIQQSFDLETKVYESRVEAAAKNLELIRRQLANRKANADAIMSKRVAEVVGETADEDAAPEEPALAAETLSSEGWQLWMKQDWAGSIVKFEKAVKLDPSSSAARNGLGWSQVHLQRPRAAVKTFRDLLDDEPDHGGARNGLGMSLLALGKLEEADVEFTNAVETAIRSIGEERAAKQGMAAWFGLVDVKKRLGKLDEAKSWAERYVKHNDDKQMKKLLEPLKRQSSD